MRLPYVALIFEYVKQSAVRSATNITGLFALSLDTKQHPCLVIMEKVLLHMSDTSHVKPLSQNYTVQLRRSLILLDSSVNEIQMLWALQNVLVSVC